MVAFVVFLEEQAESRVGAGATNLFDQGLGELIALDQLEIV